MRSRFNVRNTNVQNDLPVELLMKELCDTKDTTDKLLTEVKNMRENFASLNQTLGLIATKLAENTSYVKQAIDKMQEAQEDMKNLMEQGSSMTVAGNDVKDMIREVKIEIASLTNELQKDRGVIEVDVQT